jgi:hypothetical protein
VFWHEMDQTIYTEQLDYFYMDKTHRHISNDAASENDVEVKAIIKKISHHTLGDIQGFITLGLDYTMILANGDVFTINAEENPGVINDATLFIDDWTFEVEMEVIEFTGFTSWQRIKKQSKEQLNALKLTRRQAIAQRFNLAIT